MRVLLIALVICGLAGCKTPAPQTVSGVKHVAGQPLDIAKSWQWTAISDAEALKLYQKYYRARPLDAADPEFAMSKDGPFQQENAERLATYRPIVLYLNEQVDKLWDMLLQKFPAMRRIPAPQVDLMISDILNAHSMNQTVCYDLPLSVNPSAGYPRLRDYALIYDGTPYLADSDRGCIAREIPEGFVQELIELHTRKYPECVFTKEEIEGVMTLVAPMSCPTHQYYRGRVDGGKKIQIMTQSNRISVESYLVEYIDDPAALFAVLAHEVAHYVRAHSAADTGDYDYFYDLRQVEDGRPTPLAPERFSQTETDMLRQISAIAFNYRHGKPLDGQMTSPRMVRAWVAVAEDITGWYQFQTALPESPCAEMYQFTNENDLTAAIGHWPEGNMIDPDTGKDLYLEYESLVVECARQVHLGEEDNIPEAIMSRSRMLRDMKTSRTFRKMGETWINAALEKDTLFEAMEEIERRVDDLIDNRAFPFIQRFVEQDVGLYTGEQEADEFMAEWMTLAGLDPKIGEQLFIAFTEARQARPGYVLLPGEQPVEKCRELFCNGYEESIVPLGDFHDAHHSGCFRAYNIRRETKVHNFDASQHSPLFDWTALNSRYQQIRQLAKQAREEFLPDSEPLPPVATRINCGG